MKCKRVLLAASVVLLCLVPALAADVSGKWTTTIKTAIGDMNYAFDFKVEGEKLTGKAVMSMGSESSESALTEGSVNGDEISFVETLKVQGQELRCEYKGKISGDEIRGSRTVGSYGTEEFVASRAK
jgi:opacity protein-like surface antigen